MAAEEQLHCWACKSLIVLSQGLSARSAFQCSLCGAVTEPPSRRGKLQARRRILTLLSKLTGLCLVAFALSIICGICFFGVRDVLPAALSSRPGFLTHSAIALLLDSIVLFSYAIAVLTDPGRPRALPHRWRSASQQHTIRRGEYDGLRFCHSCDDIKPPGSHHCRTCDQCVVDCDHHCPFIANCIGVDTARPFLVFLFWGIVGTLYAACACVYAFFARKRDMLELVRSIFLYRRYYESLAQSRKTSISAMSVRLRASLLALFRAPRWINSALGILFTSLLVCILLLGLLLSQLRYAASGATYIDTLQGSELDAQSRAEKMRNLRSIFGNAPVLAWVMPRLSPAPGARCTRALAAKVE